MLLNNARSPTHTIFQQYINSPTTRKQNIKRGTKNVSACDSEKLCEFPQIIQPQVKCCAKVYEKNWVDCPRFGRRMGNSIFFSGTIFTLYEWWLGKCEMQSKPSIRDRGACCQRHVTKIGWLEIKSGTTALFTINEHEKSFNAGRSHY